MEIKRFNVLHKNNSCVLLKDKTTKMYQVRDIENDIIYMGNDFELALQTHHEYDIETVRKAREELFHGWLDKNT